MRYSIWHKEILIGYTELSYDTCMPKMRMGELDPTDEGLAILLENEHLEGLELHLRLPNGKVVPTERISAQDANRLARLGQEAMERDKFDDEDLDAETRAAIEHDVALIEEWLAENEPDEFWKDYESEDTWDYSQPFYQVFVHLLDDTDIPR